MLHRNEARSDVTFIATVIHRSHDRLPSEVMRNLGDKINASSDGDLIGPRSKELLDMISRANATANRKRTRKLICHLTHQSVIGLAALASSPHVQEDQLINLSLAIEQHGLDGRSHPAPAIELLALHQLIATIEQDGDYSRGERSLSPSNIFLFLNLSHVATNS